MNDYVERVEHLRIEKHFVSMVTESPSRAFLDFSRPNPAEHCVFLCGKAFLINFSIFFYSFALFSETFREKKPL